MLANGIDSLLLQITNLPGVHKSAILPSTTLTIIACEIDTHQLSETLGEDVSSLHVRLFKETHSQFLQTLVCRGPLVSITGRHGRVTLGGISTTRILSIVTSCAFIVISWGANFYVVYRVDVVFINAAPATENRHVRGLCECNLIDEKPS